MVANVGSFPSLPLYVSVSRKDKAAELAKFEQRPLVKRAIDEYRKALQTVTTPEQFVNNPKLLRFALTAYGQENEMVYLARAKQAMLSDPLSKTSVVGRMANPELLKANKAFSFFYDKLTVAKDPAFIEEVIDNYVLNKWEAEFGRTSPPVQNALYFARKIKDVTQVVQIMGDKTMRQVIVAALNLPEQIANLPPAKQLAMVSAKVDLDRVNDPAYVEGLVRNYLARQDVKAAGERANPIFLLFQNP